jgi:hypothetical protein
LFLLQLAAPKSKYIEHILIATRSGEAGVAEIFRTLQFRLRDSTWTIVFKSLIVLHLMIREGAESAALEYLSENPRKIAISSFSEGEIKHVLYFCALLILDSPIARHKYPEIFRLLCGSRPRLFRFEDRLCTQWTGPIKALDSREGLAARDRGCAEANKGIAQMRRTSGKPITALCL